MIVIAVVERCGKPREGVLHVQRDCDKKVSIKNGKMLRWNKRSNSMGQRTYSVLKTNTLKSSNSVCLSSFPWETNPCLPHNTNDSNANLLQGFPLILVCTLSDSYLLMKLFS